MTEATVTSGLLPKTPIGCELIAERLASQLEAPILIEPITMFLISFTRFYDNLLNADPGEMVTTATAQPIDDDMQLSRMECRVTIGAVTLTVGIDQNLRMRRVAMPMKYDPDTGVPRYVPDIGEEIEEGVTPEPKVITTKSDVFKGDKMPTKEQYERLRDVSEENSRRLTKALRDGPTVANAESYVVGVPLDVVDPSKVDAGEADKMLADAIKGAKPAKLDKDIATDQEVADLERLIKEQAIANWPIMLRLINRLRQAEAK